jgi:uncharacterized lipoprotein YehR (DUF1307 family)
MTRFWAGVVLTLVLVLSGCAGVEQRPTFRPALSGCEGTDVCFRDTVLKQQINSRRKP